MLVSLRPELSCLLPSVHLLLPEMDMTLISYMLKVVVVAAVVLLPSGSGTCLQLKIQFFQKLVKVIPYTCRPKYIFCCTFSLDSKIVS